MAVVLFSARVELKKYLPAFETITPYFHPVKCKIVRLSIPYNSSDGMLVHIYVFSVVVVSVYNVHGVRVGGVCVMYAVYLFLMSVYVVSVFVVSVFAVSVFVVSVFEVSVYMVLSGAVLGQCRIATFLTCSYGRIAKHIA